MCEVLLDTGQSRSGYHRLEVLMECPRKFGYREVLKLRPHVLPRPLALGTAGHNALAAYYGGENYKGVLKKAEDSWAFVVPEVHRIMESYVKQFFHESFETLAVEREFQIKIDGFDFTRRVDRVLLDRGKAYVMDHKFTGRPDLRQISNREDPALFTQAVVAQETFENELGYPFGGVIVNMIQTKAPYTVVRQQPKFFDGLLKEARTDLGYWLAMANRFVRTDRPVATWPKSWRCQGRYSHCEYAVLCRFGIKHMDQFRIEA